MDKEDKERRNNKDVKNTRSEDREIETTWQAVVVVKREICVGTMEREIA